MPVVRDCSQRDDMLSHLRHALDELQDVARLDSRLYAVEGDLLHYAIWRAGWQTGYRKGSDYEIAEMWRRDRDRPTARKAAAKARRRKRRTR